jgi:hypothetical protein
MIMGSGFLFLVASCAVTLCLCRPTSKGHRYEPSSSSEDYKASVSQHSNRSDSFESYAYSPSSSHISSKGKKGTKGKDRLFTITEPFSSEKATNKVTFNYGTFQQDLKGTGLNCDSTPYEIDQATYKILDRYPHNPHPLQDLKAYLSWLGVPEKRIEYFQLTRDRVQLAMHKEIRREKERKGTRTFDRAKFFLKRQRAFPETTAEEVGQTDEMKVISDHVQLESFYRSLLQYGLSYDLDPFSYALKEIPFREKWGAQSYRQYQGQLLRAFNIRDEWIEEYKKAHKSIWYQSGDYKRRHGGKELPKEKIKRPQWALQFSPVDAAEMESYSSPPPAEYPGHDDKRKESKLTRWAMTKKRSGLGPDDRAGEEWDAGGGSYSPEREAIAGLLRLRQEGDYFD